MSKMGHTGLKSSVSSAVFLLETLGVNPFHGLFQLRETAYLKTYLFGG